MLTRTTPICWTMVCRWLLPLGGSVRPNWAPAGAAGASADLAASTQRGARRAERPVMGFSSWSRTGGGSPRRLRRKGRKVARPGSRPLEQHDPRHAAEPFLGLLGIEAAKEAEEAGKAHGPIQAE